MHHKTVLKNGVRIVSEQIDSLRSVSLGVWVDAGSRDEWEEENGISHFIEHMVFRGTRNRTSVQIAKELDAVGGLSNAFTGKENTCFHARVLGKHFDLLADILSDIFLNSIFNPEDVEKERQIILQEINMVEDTPEENVHVLFQQLFWAGHPIGMPVLGTNRTVSSIGKDSILRYMNQLYVPTRIIVVAAGAIDHQRLVSHFQPLFEDLPNGGTPYSRSLPRCSTGCSFHHKNLEQVHICLGAEGPSVSADKRFACAILNTILGGNMSSRLFQEVREKQGLAYSVYSFLSAYVDTGVLSIYVATDGKNVNPAIRTIRSEIKKICAEGISADELGAAKEHLIGAISLASESADNQMMRTAKNEIIFQRYISYEELIKDLHQVTVDEVVEVASEIFREGRITMTTLGPMREEDFDMNCLRFD